MVELRFDSGRICVAQRNSAGALTLYGRIARADHPMVYRGATGARNEIIPSSELFRTDSLATFQTLPVTHEHPTSRTMSPDTWRTDGRGATHPTFIKEVTSQGTFLGQLFTVFDKDLADAIEGGAVRGLSPGYSIDGIDRVDGMTFAQRGRKGNHLAVVSNPRGGAGVEAMLEGLRVDAEDDLIWICDAADDLYAGDVDDWYQNQITEYIRGNRVDGLIAKTPTTLPVTPMTEIKNDKFDPAVFFAKKGSKKAVDDEEEMEGEDDEEMACTGKGCKCDKCKPKGKKRMDEQDLTQTIEQVVADRLDAAEKIRNDEETRTAMVDRITELEEQNAKLVDLLEEAADELDAEDDRTDSEDAVVFNSVNEFAETAANLFQEFNQMRADAALLGSDLVTAYGDERKAIVGFVNDAQDLKRELLGRVAPTVRTDSLDDAALDATYEIAMTSVREAAAKSSSTRTDSSVQRLSLLGQVAPASAAQAPARKSLSSNFYARVEA